MAKPQRIHVHDDGEPLNISALNSSDHLNNQTRNTSRSTWQRSSIIHLEQEDREKVVVASRQISPPNKSVYWVDFRRVAKAAHQWLNEWGFILGIVALLIVCLLMLPFRKAQLERAKVKKGRVIQSESPLLEVAI